MTMDHPGPRRTVDYYLLWAVALVSLGLNLYLLNPAPGHFPCPEQHE